MGLHGKRGPDGSRVGGVPDLILWDRGLEFLSDLVQETCDAFRTHGIALPPFSPHRKGKKERWYRTLKSECIDHLPGLTRGPKDLRDQSYTPDEAVDGEFLAARIDEYIDEYNFERRHSALGMTPWEAWQADDSPLFPAPEFAVYDAMLRAKHKPKVGHEGIHFKNGKYKSDALAEVVGLTVEVRYLPNDLETIEVFHEGAHLCTAVHADAMTPVDRERLLSERNAARADAFALRRKTSKAKRERAREAGALTSIVNVSHGETVRPLDPEEGWASLFADEPVAEQLEIV